MVVPSPVVAQALGYKKCPGPVPLPLYIQRRMERVPGPLHAQVFRAVDEDLSVQSVVEVVLQSSLDMVRKYVGVFHKNMKESRYIVVYLHLH